MNIVRTRIEIGFSLMETAKRIPGFSKLGSGVSFKRYMVK